jgi:hypothetical protein
MSIPLLIGLLVAAIVVVAVVAVRPGSARQPVQAQTIGMVALVVAVVGVLLFLVLGG